MKEVTINNTTYVSIASLAKEFKYTTDYLGQLCRAKKVDAQLVGRSWYLNPDSLKKLRSGGRYSRNKTKLDASGAEATATVIPIRVEPVMAKATVKMGSYALKESTNFAKRIDWKPLKYDTDKGDLLPKLSTGEPERIKVNLADATELAIKSGPKSTAYISEGLPVVTLKGKLSITSLEEEYDLSEDEEVTFDYKEEFLERIDHKKLTNTLPARPVQLNTSPVFAAVTTSEVTTARFNQVEVILFVATTALSCFLVSLVFLENIITASSSGVVSQNYLLEGKSLVALLSKL